MGHTRDGIPLAIANAVNDVLEVLLAHGSAVFQMGECALNFGVLPIV